VSQYLICVFVQHTYKAHLGKINSAAYVMSCALSL